MKVINVLLHIFLSIPLCLILLISKRDRQEKVIQYWSKKLLHILDIKVEVRGLTEHLLDQKKYLMVANHISWLDIIVIQSIKPSIFVAKSDVASWFLLGWVARMTGTIFINREQVSDVKKSLKRIRQRLIKRTVCIFPEGTSTNGRYVMPFKSNLFQASINTRKSILPICLSYEQEKKYTDQAAFIGDMTLIDSIHKIKSHRNILAVLEVLPIIKPHASRKELANYAHEMIQKCLSQNLS